MRLTPQETDRLLIFTAAELARSRRARGLRLNVPEAVALISATVIEAARDGLLLTEAVTAGRGALGPAEVLPGVAAVVAEVRVEAVFDDGTRLVVVPDPIGSAPGDGPATGGEPAPGTVIPAAGPEPGGPPDEPDVAVVTVTNTAAVPISVTSHWHFFEANPWLAFDRAAGYGRHLLLPAGTSVRFDPGVAVEVRLVPIGGKRIAIGFAGLVDGPLDAPGGRERALARAAALGYRTVAPQS